VGGARFHPGRFEQQGFFSDDIYADRELGYFAPYVPGAYDETNRY
jgi:hypothetical protein